MAGPKISAPRFKGKLKREIADEAFQKIGPDATVAQVDAYFKKHYKIPTCERSMFAAAKRRANGKPSPLPRRYRRNASEVDVLDVIVRAKQLALDLGSWDKLIELASILKGTST